MPPGRNPLYWHVSTNTCEKIVQNKQTVYAGQGALSGGNLYRVFSIRRDQGGNICTYNVMSVGVGPNFLIIS
jgi:hypothetical protein